VPSREPKRTYSPAAIEKWFDRLLSNWEKYFVDEELAKGRELYRDCHVRELQLAPDSIVVHCKDGRDDVYSVVEWENGAPNVRSGTTDKFEGRALAAAGLYETEELIAAEVSPLPPEDKPAVASVSGVVAVPVAAPAPEAPVRTKKNVAGGKSIGDAAPKREPAPDAKPAKPVHMRLRLTATDLGVRLCGFWVDGKTERNAFASMRDGDTSFSSSDHRELLLRLTLKAKHAGFTHRAAKSDYILRDPLSITTFVKRDLPRWRDTFDVVADPRLTVFGEGVRKVNIRAIAHKLDGRGVGVDWSAWIDGKVLERSHATALFRRPGQILISPELGLLRIDSNQSADLADWPREKQEDPDAPLPYYMLFSLFQSETLPLELSPELEVWRNKVMKSPTGDEKDLPGFLREYQRRGVTWMNHLLSNGCHCLLADEMGLGKTVQVLTMMAKHGESTLPSLIVCPASVVPVWFSEAAKFFPGLHLEVLQSGHTWEEIKEPCVWVSSYTQLRRHRHIVAGRQFAYAVLDEAQFIKNPDAKITQVCLALKAERRVAVTGTPIENRELDLWSIFRFLMPGLLGSRGHLEKQALNDPQTLRENLRRQVSPFILRRSKTEVASELPPKVESILNCPLTQLQEGEYKRLAKEGLASLGDDLKKSLQERTLPFFTLLTRLRQTCCDPGLLPWMDCDPRQSGKTLALIEKLHELVDHGRRAVIFSQFASLLARLKTVIGEEFPDLPIEMLTGHTTNREKPVAAFQKSTGAAVMLVSLKAGGTGITLSAAEYVFLMDPWWNPAVEAQAIDRVHRIGQDRTVFIYRLIATGTVEERIELLKQQKRELFDGTVGRLADMSRFQNYFHSLTELIGSAEVEQASDSD
jgi:superfamily II DNA or RNA helicase